MTPAHRRFLVLIASIGIALSLTLGLVLPATAEESTSAGGNAESQTIAQATEQRDVGVGLREGRRRDAIEEITVTARKREERLQEAPISVTAFGVEALKHQTLSRIDEVGEVVPNFQFDGTVANTEARMFIRGVGSGDGIPTRDPGVGIYLDGMYLARAQGSVLAVSDIERIEVLRGPQGTLYGRNTIGGAVNVITRKPGETFGGEAMLRLGNLDSIETRASLNVPLLNERLYSRLSFVTRTRDGYMENKGPGGDTGDDEKLIAGRAALRFLATDSLTLDVTGDFSRQHQDKRGAHCKYNDLAPAATNLLPNGQALASLNPLMNMPPINYRDHCIASRNLDTDEYISNINTRANLDTQGLNATATWVTDAATLKLISGWRRQLIAVDSDWDATPRRFGTTDTLMERDGYQLSNELNVSGVALGERLAWTVGGYAFHESSDPTVPLTAVATDIANHAFLPFIGLDPLDFSFSEMNWISNTNFAGYGQFTYDLSDRLSLTAGVRRLVEKKGWKHRRHWLVGDPFRPEHGPVQCGVGPNGIDESTTPLDPANGLFRRPRPETCAGDDVPLSLKTTERFDAWTGLLNLRYQVHDDLIFYAQWASGYKSGGFNGRTNPDAPATLEGFQPEELDSYEIGMKSAWFDRRLILNIAAFHSDYEEIQQTVLMTAPDGSFASVVRNAGEAVMRGGEVELQAMPIPGLHLSAALGVLDAKYEENRQRSREDLPGPDGILDGYVCGNGLVADPPECAELSPGTQLSSEDDLPKFVSGKDDDFFNLPAYTFHVSAAYTVQTRIGDLTPRVSWYHQSEINYNPNQDNDFATQDKVGLLNARLSLELNDGQTEIALWGRNILDREYINDVTSFDDGFAVTNQYYAPPRTYGIEIRRSFESLSF